MTTHDSLHEDPDKLSPATVDRHRAIVSLMEELEAVDWYDQRIEATENPELRGILAHNRDEEKEHAAMLIEWLRRNDSAFEGELKDYAFSEGSIAGREEPPPPIKVDDGTLGIGSLKEV